MIFGSLFSGIGGIDLGLERSGMKCLWQVENDSFCQGILRKNWPDVGRWDDVRTFPPSPVEDWKCDLICGGFPCQDISNAGNRTGILGERSGLWSEFARIIGLLQPGFVLVENVPALLVRGIDSVLRSLSTFGYNAEWRVISASSFGFTHKRERIFIVAYHTSIRRPDHGNIFPINDKESVHGQSIKKGGEGGGKLCVVLMGNFDCYLDLSFGLWLMGFPGSWME